MRILDKYIIREYLKNFLIIILAFSVLFIVVDIFDRLPRLLAKGATTKQLVLYFLTRIPYLFVLTSPVSVLLSGLFLMSSLSKYNESIAIRAAGISIFRMVLPLLIFGFLFSFVMIFFGEYVLPKAEDYNKYIYRNQIKKQPVQDIKMRSDIRYRGKDNYFYYIRFFDGYRNILKIIDITHYDPNTGKIQKKITADEGVWRKDKWVLKNCYIRKFDSDSIISSTKFDSTSLKEINITPLDLIKSAKKPIQMNYFELREYIQRLKKVGQNYNKNLVELYLKISFPFANFIILLFSVPLASSSVRSKWRGMIFLVGLMICFLFLSSLRISQSLGYNNVIPPLLAAWLPNIVFTTIGAIFVIKSEV